MGKKYVDVQHNNRNYKLYLCDLIKVKVVQKKQLPKPPSYSPPKY